MQRKTIWQRLGFLILSACLTAAAAAVPSQAEQEIFLCGETHAQEDILAQELSLWQVRYAAGDRDLLVEMGAPTAILLNRWLETGDESFWDLVYSGWEGTVSHQQSVADFYHALKKTCPETVFHGIDLEHQYQSTGAFCLALLQKEGRQETEEYRQAQRAVEQGAQFYGTWDGEDLYSRDNAYRETVLAENFCAAYEALGRKRVMGIFGSAHVDPYGPDYYTGTVPSMAAQLKESYGGRVHIRDLRGEDVLKETTLTIAGKTYRAVYYGEYPIAQLDNLRSRQFWRLMDACETFSQWEGSGDNLPGSNYAMAVCPGEAYAIHYTRWVGEDFWWYGVCEDVRREDGSWNTAEVTPPTMENG